MKRLLVLALLVPLAACGGGGADDPKAAYVGKAKAVCDKAKSDRAAVPQPTGTAGVVTYARTLVDLAAKAAADLRALEEPAADKAALEAKLLDPLDRQVVVGRTYVEQLAAAGNDSAKLLPLLTNRPDALGQIDVQYAKSYGLGACIEALQA